MSTDRDFARRLVSSLSLHLSLPGHLNIQAQILNDWSDGRLSPQLLTLGQLLDEEVAEMGLVEA